MRFGSYRIRPFPLVIAVLAFLLVNGFSWRPGFGTSTAGPMKWEIERYFGWPAYFYVDLWRMNNRPQLAGDDYWTYGLPIPRANAEFAYSSLDVERRSPSVRLFGVVPLLLNLSFFAAVTAVYLLRSNAYFEDLFSVRERKMRKMLIGVALVIWVLSFPCSVHL